MPEAIMSVLEAHEALDKVLCEERAVLTQAQERVNAINAKARAGDAGLAAGTRQRVAKQAAQADQKGGELMEERELKFFWINIANRILAAGRTNIEGTWEASIGITEKLQKYEDAAPGIVRSGCPLSEPLARAIFPHFKNLPYGTSSDDAD